MCRRRVPSKPESTGMQMSLVPVRFCLAVLDGSLGLRGVCQQRRDRVWNCCRSVALPPPRLSRRATALLLHG